MTDQGFFGAIEQYWDIEPKPRLNRRNSWAREHEPKIFHLNIILFSGVFTVILFMIFCMLEALF